jgi:two-component system, OmpR family, alkaline phosphatase synthesis response regulator PhoP
MTPTQHKAPGDTAMATPVSTPAKVLASERVLIVEDEQHIAAGLRFNLEAEGYEVHTVETGEAALELLLAPAQLAPEQVTSNQVTSNQVTSNQLTSAELAPEQVPFDVIVLDVMLPGKSGFEVVSELRQAGQFVPTLMLTARGRPEDVLLGFAAGADDYLPKPFELAILIARIHSLLRRKQWLRVNSSKNDNSKNDASKNGAPAVDSPKAEPRDSFVFGDKSIHYDLLQLRVGDHVYPLTLMEANILRYLIDREGQTVSRKNMLQEVWGLHEDTDTRAIDNFIVRLRRYLEQDPARPRHLLTVRGIGYRFVALPDA